MENGQLPWSDFIVHGVNKECDFLAPVKLIEIFAENVGLRFKEIKATEYWFQAHFSHGNEMKRGCKHANVRKKSV